VLPVSVTDFRALAKARLPHFLFEYLDGGANSEATLRANAADLEALALRQRVLAGTDLPETGVELFGRRWRLPVALAPVGVAGMYARRGERQAARAADGFGVPFTLSTVSVCPIEDVHSPFWMQLYVMRDRGFLREVIARAKAAGCGALMFTVDMPVAGIRYRDYRSGLAGAPGLAGHARRFAQAVARPRWAWDVGVRGRPHVLGNIAPLLRGKTGLEDFFAWMRDNFDPTVSWRDLDEIRKLWDGPLIVKGILDVEDARRVANAGADGLVVSNHGGRQLDGVLSTARALGPIADAVGDRLTVLADGGVRSGLDIARMLALGAKGVLIGRPWVYALAAGGEAAVLRLLENLERELRIAMVLTGCSAVSKIDSGALA